MRFFGLLEFKILHQTKERKKARQPTFLLTILLPPFLTLWEEKSQELVMANPTEQLVQQPAF